MNDYLFRFGLQRIFLTFPKKRWLIDSPLSNSHHGSHPLAWFQKIVYTSTLTAAPKRRQVWVSFFFFLVGWGRKAGGGEAEMVPRRLFVLFICVWVRVCLLLLLLFRDHSNLYKNFYMLSIRPWIDFKFPSKTDIDMFSLPSTLQFCGKSVARNIKITNSLVW